MTELSELITAASGLTNCPAWQALEDHRDAVADLHLNTLLDEPERYPACSRQACGLTLDYSRNFLTTETIELLMQLATERELGAWIEHLLTGARVNNTEDRPALHTALRRPEDRPLVVDGKDVMPLVRDEREKFLAFAEAVRDGSYIGATGK